MLSHQDTTHQSESGSDQDAAASPLSANSADYDQAQLGASSSRGDGKKFQCPRCGASFTRPSSLRQHLLIHTGEKPHPCALCPKRFSVVSNLRRHFRSCEGVKSRTRSANASTKQSTSPGATIPLLPSFEIEMSGTDTTATDTQPSMSTRNQGTLSSQHVFQAVIKYPSTVGPQRPPRPPYIPRPPSQRYPSTTPTTVSSTLDPELPYPPSLAHFSNAEFLTSSWSIAKEGSLPYIPITMPLPPVNPSNRSFMNPSPNLGIPLTDFQPVGDREGDTDSAQDGMGSTVGVSSSGSASSLPPGQNPPLNLITEERDSYDVTAPTHPYHPACWRGKLPGPGLMEVDRILEEVAPGYRRM